LLAGAPSGKAPDKLMREHAGLFSRRLPPCLHTTLTTAACPPFSTP